MAAEPIYPDQLDFALDRLFTRVTNFVNARLDEVLTQMRVDRQESLARDQLLLKRVEANEKGIRDLAEAILTLTQQVSDLTQQVSDLTKRVSTIETRLDAVEATQTATMQLIRDLHAEAMEGINELRQRGKE